MYTEHTRCVDQGLFLDTLLPGAVGISLYNAGTRVVSHYTPTACIYNVATQYIGITKNVIRVLLRLGSSY